LNNQNTRLNVEQQLKLFNESPIVIYACKPDGDFGTTFISAGIRNLLGWEPRDFLEDASFWASNIHPDDKKRVLAGLPKLFEAGAYTHEYRFRHKDGSYRFMNGQLKVEYNESGSPVKLIGYWTDVTDRRKAENILRANEAKLSGILELAIEAIISVDANRHIQIFNKGAEAVFGYRSEEIFGEPIEKLMPERYRSAHPHYIATFADAPESSREMNARGEITGLRKDGTEFPAMASVSKLKIGDETAYTVVLRDISERKQAETRLRESEERFRSAFENTSVGMGIRDVRNQKFMANKALQEMLQYSQEELERLKLRNLEEPEKEDHNAALRQSLFAGEIANYQMAKRYRRKDGEFVWILTDRALIRAKGGEPIFVVNLHQDVTQLRNTEAQLRQAQRMEVVGQLTGGIAHDFNNILAVLQGNVDLLSEELGGDHPRLQTIIRASERAGELTQRLLAFSRQQPLAPTAVDPRALFNHIHELLVRTLGETIEIEILVADDTWSVMADPGQVENALLNLAINARDAMQGGGKLAFNAINIELNSNTFEDGWEVTEGDYVRLSVRDSGTGMASEIRERVFEPFFTTKEVGEGSGLGLSMVYGFAKQSNGHVAITSEEGVGTTINLYLPRAVLAPEMKEFATGNGPAKGRGQIILVLEDDVDLSDLAAEVLEELGYRAVTANSAVSAHEILAAEEHVDLVLSDVVLPGGTNGFEFADQAREKVPDLKFVFMSGYPTDAISQWGTSGVNNTLLKKPFKMKELAEVLADALGDAE
jgi:PAS domain S-box-containing protein